MIQVVPFRPYHIELLRAQGVQQAQLREVSNVPGTYETVARGPALTAFEGEHVILCGGIAILAPARGVCWALLSERAARHMVFLHYAVKRFISVSHWERLEASVEENFAQGCRWLELLGFSFEGRMPKYGLDGATHLRYGKT